MHKYHHNTICVVLVHICRYITFTNNNGQNLIDSVLRTIFHPMLVPFNKNFRWPQVKRTFQSSKQSVFLQNVFLKDTEARASWTRSLRGLDAFAAFFVGSKSLFQKLNRFGAPSVHTHDIHKYNILYISASFQIRSIT